MPVIRVSVLHSNPSTTMETNNGPIKYHMKAFLWCLKITGLKTVTARNTNKLSVKVKRYLRIFYGHIIPCLLLYNFVFSLGEFIHVSDLDAPLLNSIISSTWFLQVGCISVNNAIRHWRWEQIYQAWDSFANDYKIDTRKIIRVPAVVIAILYIFWLVLAESFLGISIVAPTKLTGFTSQVSREVAMVLNVFVFIAYFFFVSTWFLLTSQFFLVCILLYRAFKINTKSIEKAIEERSLVIDKVEEYRQQHERICSLLESADEILCIFVACIIFSTIPLIVLTLYFVLFLEDGAITFAYVATWWSITLSTLQLSLVFLAGGAVNFAAHQCCSLLYRIDLRGAEPDKILQFSVFLNRLTSQPIGLTALGLFVLDKPTIIAFVGSILTYAIVIIQFKPSSSCSTVTEVICNCSST